MTDEPTQPADSSLTLSALDPEAADSLVDSDRPVGMIGGRYEILGVLARGGMGVVCRGRDLVLNRPVAVKVMHERLVSDRAILRFQYEAHITGQLEHPSIPPVHDMGRLDDGRPFLVMKLIQGATLDERIRDEASALHVLGVFEAICQAIGYAHSRGVLHRDLKPANIMVGSFGEVQVMDWGLAKELAQTGTDAGDDASPRLPSGTDADSKTMAGSVLGSPAYMPPEQATGSHDRVTTRSDVFGLGGILCAMLTHGPVYDGGDPESTRQQAAQGNVGRAHSRLDLCGAEPGVVALAKRCLAVDPQERPADGNEVATLVARLRADAEERARQAELARNEALVREAEGRKRRMLIAGSAAVVVAVLMAGIVVSTRQTQRAWDAEDEIGRQLLETQRAKRDEQAAKMKAIDFRNRALNALRATLGEDVVKLLGERRDLTANERAYLDAIARRWQSFALQEGDDEATRAIQAEGHYNVATLWMRMGRRDEARVEFERAVDLWKRLAADFPKTRDYRSHLARTRVNLGAMLHELGLRQEAVMQFQEALALQKELAAANVANPDDRLETARSLHNLAVLSLDLGNRVAAIEQHREGLALVEKLAAEHPEATAARALLAGFHAGLGGLFTASGEQAEAEKHFRAGVTVLEQLVAEVPASRDFRADLAGVHAGWGRLLNDLGRLDEAEEHYRRSLAIRERLAAEFPGVPDYPSHLSASYNNLGNLLTNLRRFDEAEQQFRQDVTLREKLVGAYPTVPGYRLDLAAAHMNLGVVLVDQNKQEAAEQEYRKAMAIQEKLVADFPEVRNHHIILAGSYCNFGNLVRDTRGPDESLGWFAKAIATLEPLVASDPQDHVARRFLRNSFWGRARTRDALHDHANALPDWNRAVELCPVSQSAQLRAERAQSLHAAGRFPEALAEATGLAEAPELNSASWYALARIHSDAATRIAGKEKEHADAAMLLLRKAVAAGFRDATALREDFAPLRGRDDFAKLLDALQ